MEGKTFWTNRSKKVHDYWTSPKDVPEYREEMIQLIVRELEKDSRKTIMDCGCGTGLLFKYLPDEYKDRYWGVDFTQEMVDYCKENYPAYADRFSRLDLTRMGMQAYLTGHAHMICVTQNVIQHILLFQQALDNIFFFANTIIMCERTHDLVTCIAGYEPAYRWRFNLKDFYDILTFFAKEYDYNGVVEIMGQPLTTDNLEKTVTIFRVYRNEAKRLTIKESMRYNIEYFIRKPMIIREYIYKPRKRDRIIKFLKSLNPF